MVLPVVSGHAQLSLVPVVPVHRCWQLHSFQLSIVPSCQRWATLGLVLTCRGGRTGSGEGEGSGVVMRGVNAGDVSSVLQTDRQH